MAPPAKASARRHVVPRTTPAWLRLAAVVLAIGSVLVGLIGGRVASQRLEAAQDVDLEARPLLIDAEDLYVALADADAAASTAFLEAGLEPPALRDRYQNDIVLAGQHLARIAGQSELSAEARAAIETIAEDLPEYTGLVEAARANNRQDFPVGAAYLRHASTLMRDTILPAATSVYADAANHLHDGYRSGSERLPVVAWIGLGGIVLVLLLVTQLFVARRTRRIVNVGLAASTVLLLGLGGWAAGAMHSEQRALVDAQREGSDHLLVLSTARILALRSLSDENLDLIERGTEPKYLEDFDDVTARISRDEDRSGLLPWAGRIADRTGVELGIDTILQRYGRYLDVHEEVRALDDGARYDEAVGRAVGDEASAAAELDDAFDESIRIAYDSLAVHAADARHALRGLTSIIVVASALAGLFAVLGLDRRIREYR
jgi:hypothetical protein